MISFRWKLRLGAAAGALMLLILSAAWMERRKGEQRLERVRQELTSKGEKLTWQELAPAAPPPDQNGYHQVVQAMAGLSGLPWATEHMPRFPLSTNGNAIRWKHLPHWKLSTGASDSETNRVTWEQWREHLAPMAEPLAAARAAIHKPYLDAALNYDAGMRLPLRHLAPMKRLANCLSAHAASELMAGHPTSAVDDAEALLRLAMHLQREPLFISQLVQISIQAVALPISWQLVHSGLLSPNDLERLQEVWTKVQAQAPMAQGLAGERVFALSGFEEARLSTSNFLAVSESALSGGTPGTPADFFEFLASAVPQTGRASRSVMWRHLFWPTDQAVMLEHVQSMIESLRRAASGASARDLATQIHTTTNAIAQLSEGSPFAELRTALSQLLLPSLANSFKRALRAEAQQRLVIAAIALQRYHLRHGSYPPTLDSLTPEYLKTPLRDPYDGLPLRYTRGEPRHEFKLYSVGENLVDDGGMLAQPTATAARASLWQAFTGSADVIWPMPASEAEARSLLRPAE
ncbi:MAG: hypothetical protein JNN07_27295 [Verrucomicrobiales bacterium]|nr:hypothetical protein [Verrucomicrobiales bacterium]